VLKLLLALSIALCQVGAAQAQVSFGIGINVPGVSIGINVPAYPSLVQVPGYPVYYDPRLNSNYFFYDGLYWVYLSDNWYASSWYNGPWRAVGPEYVPLYVLRVPVRYYRRPPTYFHGWRPDAPPHWGEHWGREWEQRRGGWDRWDRRAAPAPAPLPTYQRSYSGSRYPSAEEQQRSIRAEKYRYQPKDEVAQQHFQQPGKPSDARAEPRQQAPVQQQAPAGQQPSPPSQQRPQAQPVQAPTRTQPRTESKSNGHGGARTEPAQHPTAQPQAPAQQQAQPSQQRTQPKPGQAPNQSPHQTEPQNKGQDKKAESQDKDQRGKN
jgi:hypothetical protein